MLRNHFPQVVALTAIAALALFTASMVNMAHPSVSASPADRSYDQAELGRARQYAARAAYRAYLDQRHGEQSVGSAASLLGSSQGFRQAEQAAARADAERAYQLYRQGERTASEAASFPESSQAFRQAEQAAARADAERAYQLYRQGERTAGEVVSSSTYLPLPPGK